MTSRTEYSTQTPNKPSLFDVQYLRNHRTLDIGVLGYIGIVWPKVHSPEVRSFPPGTPCICPKNQEYNPQFEFTLSVRLCTHNFFITFLKEFKQAGMSWLHALSLDGVFICDSIQQAVYRLICNKRNHFVHPSVLITPNLFSIVQCWQMLLMKHVL